MPGEPPRLQARLVVAASEHGARPRLDVDLAIGAGLTVVTGPSGAGKSTLLSALAGLLRPRQGRVVLDDETLVDVDAGVFVPPHRRKVGLVFQSLALFPHKDVLDNVAFGVVEPDPRAVARRWLERMRVGGLAGRRPSTLSGGEAQRVALARALAARPRLLLLDEPFSALDVPLRRSLGQELQALVRETDLPTLLVTHDAGDAALADRHLHLDAGRLVDTTGTP
jgi:molybdate transport system ATP-binding protein